MKARALRRLSRALHAAAFGLGQLTALLDMLVSVTPEPEPPRVPNACQFCGAPPGRPMCHGCPGVWRGAA